MAPEKKIAAVLDRIRERVEMPDLRAVVPRMAWNPVFLRGVSLGV